MRLLWSDPALEDLSEIRNWIAAENARAALVVLRQIAAAARALLLDIAYLGRPGRVEGTREIPVRNTPYIIVYRRQNETIAVLRVLHGARRWPSSF